MFPSYGARTVDQAPNPIFQYMTTLIDNQGQKLASGVGNKVSCLVGKVKGVGSTLWHVVPAPIREKTTTAFPYAVRGATVFGKGVAIFLGAHWVLFSGLEVGKSLYNREWIRAGKWTASTLAGAYGVSRTLQSML